MRQGPVQSVPLQGGALLHLGGFQHDLVTSTRLSQDLPPPESTQIDEDKKTPIKEKSRKRIEEVKTPEVIHLGSSDRIRNS